jgi:hypothetical protein
MNLAPAVAIKAPGGNGQSLERIDSAVVAAPAHYTRDESIV